MAAARLSLHNSRLHHMARPRPRGTLQRLLLMLEREKVRQVAEAPPGDVAGVLSPGMEVVVVILSQ